MISGIGVFYPDKSPTQRVGIVPDIEVSPTVEGIRTGRDEVLEAVRSGLTEVALWGHDWPINVGGQVDSTEYQLSAAARAFKGHALAAAGLVELGVGETEKLYRSGYQPPGSGVIEGGRCGATPHICAVEGCAPV